MPQITASSSRRQAVAIDAGVAAGKFEDVVAQRRGGQRHRLAGDHRAGAGEGAGVVGREIGVGVDDVDLRRREQPRIDAAICRCDVTEPLPISVEPTAR